MVRYVTVIIDQTSMKHTPIHCPNALYTAPPSEPGRQRASVQSKAGSEDEGDEGEPG
jgi:hypothetical protein